MSPAKASPWTGCGSRAREPRATKPPLHVPITRYRRCCHNRTVQLPSRSPPSPRSNGAFRCSVCANRPLPTRAPLQTCSLRHHQTPRRKDASRNECLKVYQKLLSTPCDCVLSPASAMPTRRCHRSAGRRRAGQGKKATNGSEKPVDKANLRLLLPFACEHLQQIDEIYSRFVQHPECARTRLSRKNIPLLVIAATNYRLLRSKARSNASKPPARTSNNRLVLFDMKTCAT